MTEYRTEIFNLVKNKEYLFYKLIIDEHCYIDEFLEKIEKNVRQGKSIAGLVALMDSFSTRLQLPRSKFRQIVCDERNDLFEFKKDALRIYVIKQPPYIYVAMGGLKNEQKRDLENFKRRTKDFPKQ